MQNKDWKHSFTTNGLSFNRCPTKNEIKQDAARMWSNNYMQERKAKPEYGIGSYAVLQITQPLVLRHGYRVTSASIATRLDK